jgi:hypothetical protein
LLKASEKSQLPLLRNALGFTQNLSEETRHHIYACSIMYIFDHGESPVAKRQKIVSLIEKAKFPEERKVDFSTYNAQYGSFSDRQGDTNAGVKEESFKNSVRQFINEDLSIDPKYNSEKFDHKVYNVKI